MPKLKLAVSNLLTVVAVEVVIAAAATFLPAASVAAMVLVARPAACAALAVVYPAVTGVLIVHAVALASAAPIIWNVILALAPEPAPVAVKEAVPQLTVVAATTLVVRLQLGRVTTTVSPDARGAEQVNASVNAVAVPTNGEVMVSAVAVKVGSVTAVDFAIAAAAME